MKSTKYLLGALFALVCLLAVNVYAEDKPADKPLIDPEGWTLSLGGSGGTTVSGDSKSVFGATIDLGHTGHLLVPLQGGLRQTFNYGDNEDGDSQVLFDTKLYLDATLFTIAKKVDVFAGGNIGIHYGNTPLLWQAAPEAGLRWWLKKDVAIVGRVEYPFDLNNGRAMEVLNYFLGFQVKL